MNAQRQLIAAVVLAHRLVALAGRAADVTREIFTAPFRVEIGVTTGGDLERADAARRAALLRLILACISALLICVSLPVALLNHPDASAVAALIVLTLLSVTCFIISERKFPKAAALLFICGNGVVTVFVSLGDPNRLDPGVVVTNAFLALFILLAGLVLPLYFLWPVTALMIAATVIGFLIYPAQPPAPSVAAPPALRIEVVGQLTSLELLTGLITWVAARIARAGTVAAARAFERERDLAALKDQFIIDANHELRTPIMSLYGNVELLASLGDGATPQQRQRLLDRALGSGDAVLRLLASVLDAGAAGATVPSVTPSPVAVRPVILSVLETFDPRELGVGARDGGVDHPRAVSVHADGELMVFADPLRLRQVLVNLISNALKYSQAGTPITIRASATTSPHPPKRGRGEAGWAHAAVYARMQPSPYVLVSVQDRGPGVTSGDAAKLFNRFVRLERDIAGPVRGTGVGLYMCRTLIEAMGGTIWVESTGVPGEGSTFMFTLPATTAETRRITALITPQSGAERPG